MDFHDTPPAAPEPTPPPTGVWNRWSDRRLLALAILMLAGNFVLQIAVFGLTDELFLPALIGSLIGVVLPAAIAARAAGSQLIDDFQIGPISPRVLLWSALLAVAGLEPTSLLAEFSARIHPVDPEWVAFFEQRLPQTSAELLVTVAAVVIAAPLAEELLFRGLVYRLARRTWGVGAAVSLSSLSFALVHGEPWYLFGLIGLGLLLAFLYEMTRSVTACWVAHAVHNSVVLYLMLHTEEVAPETAGPAAVDYLRLAGSLILLAAAGYQLYRYGRAAGGDRGDGDAH
jgi:membrane protease YdiL (CAAX protease family)